MPENSLDLANFLQNAVKNNGDNNGWGNNGMLWIFLLLLFGYGGFGIGNRFGMNGMGMDGRTTPGTLANDAAITGAVETAIAKAQAAGVSDQLMLQAVNGNKEALSNIAQALNADMNRVQEALCTIKGGIDKVAGEVGMSTQQVINAIQSGNASVISQLQSCCCDIRNAITNANYENQLQIVNQTNTIGQQIQAQTTFLGAKIDNQTQVINDRFCQLELREQSRIIEKQNRDISDLKNRLSTQEILAAVATRAPATTTTTTTA